MARIRAALEVALQPVALDVIDDSHKHAGHEGAGKPEKQSAHRSNVTRKSLQ